MTCPRCKEGILKGGTGLFLFCPKCNAEYDLNMKYIRTTLSRKELEKKFLMEFSEI